jgi:hypothetical protein
MNTHYERWETSLYIFHSKGVFTYLRKGAAEFLRVLPAPNPVSLNPSCSTKAYLSAVCEIDLGGFFQL